TLYAALYMVEITRMLLGECDPNPRVFDLLSAALGRLDRDDAPMQAVIAFFQWRLLHHIGLAGEMDHCVSCGRAMTELRSADIRRGVYFTSGQGGLLCRNCQSARTEKRHAGPNVLAGLMALRALDRRQKATLSEHQAAAVNDLLAYHVIYQLGKTPKMLRHIRQT
ncbi:MAG: DNA repair protein RecO, partial [Planctomycetes bacterium]|nr:DNA repair protein RecO [Planctomycetota bacterium]